MTEEKKSRESKEEEKRRLDRFAWLGPLMERRKARAEPIDEEEEGKEPEEIE